MRWLVTAGAVLLYASVAAAGLDSSGAPNSELRDLLGQAGIDLPAGAVNTGLKEGFFRKLDPQAKVFTREEAIAVRDLDGTPERTERWPLGILYVKVSSIDDGSCKGLTSALEAGTNAAVSGIVLDLRGADGRNPDEVEGLAGLFLAAGTPICRVMSSEGKHSRTLLARGRSEPLVAATTVILIDANTGGLAEMLAGALARRPNMLVLGRPSSGFSAIRQFVPFGDGRHVLIATGWADWGSGVKKAVEPDFVFADNSVGHTIPEPRRAGRQSPELTKLLRLTADDRVARLATDFLLSQVRLGQRAEGESEDTED